MVNRTRRFIAVATALSLLLSIPGLPAYAAAATISRGAFSTTPTVALPGNYAPAALTPLTPTSLSLFPTILQTLPAAAVTAAAPTAAPIPAGAPAASASAAPGGSVHETSDDLAARQAVVFDGALAHATTGGDRGSSDAVAARTGGSFSVRLAPTPARAVTTLGKGFIPATVIVAKLEKTARTDPEQGYAQAVGLIEDREDTRREPKLAALRVLAGLPIARTLPYYVQSLRSAASDETTKNWGGGSKALWYIQREILIRLAAQPRALKESAEALSVVQESYKDGNASVRLAAAAALKSVGIEPGLERDDDALLSVDTSSSDDTRDQAASARQSKDDKPGLLTRLGKMSPWKKGLLGVMAAATIGLGAAGHFLAPTYVAPQTPAAIVSVQPATPAPAVPAKIVPPAKPAVKAPVQTPVKTQVPVKKLTWEQTMIERQTRANEDTAYRIKELGEKVTAAQQQKDGTGKMSGILQIALFIGGFFLISSFIRAWAAKRSGGGKATEDINKKGKSIHTLTMPGANPMRFTDVEGMDENLIESTELVEFLRNPAKFRRLGAHIPRGVLMDGPPGTGKTLTAKALAGEAGVPFFSLSGSDFQEMLVGVGSARVRDLIAEAKKHKASIIFIDEIDAIGQARGGANANPEQESTLNSILTAMDGFGDADGIVFIGATNRADLLDKALTRSGRFDRKVHVGLPHMGGREAILAIHATKSRLSPQLDLQYVARRTTGLAGADLANIINDAAILAARRGADAVEAQDIDRAVDKATFGDERRMPVPDEIKRRVAYHEAGHVLASLLNEDPALRQKVNKFTMVPHSNGSLGLAEFDSADNFMYTRAQLEAKIDVALGGLVAEKLIFGSDEPIPGQWSTGPGNDLEQATKIAKAMIQTLGMGSKTGLAVTAPAAQDYGRSPFGDQIAALVHAEVNALLSAAYKRVTERLKRNRHVLEALTAAVLEKETIIGDQIEETIREAGPVSKKTRKRK